MKYSFNSYSGMSCTASNGKSAAGLLAVSFAFLERLISLLNEEVALARFTSGVSRHHSAQYSTSFVTHVTQEILSQRHYIYKAAALQSMITVTYMLLYLRRYGKLVVYQLTHAQCQCVHPHFIAA
jgi:hypothetical protein